MIFISTDPFLSEAKCNRAMYSNLILNFVSDKIPEIPMGTVDNSL